MQTQATQEPQIALQELPNDTAALHCIIRDLENKMAEKDETVSRIELENKLLREQKRYLQQQLYGRKSEKVAPGDDKDCQTFLFADFAEENNEEEDADIEEITIPSHKRKKRGRKTLSDHSLRPRWARLGGVVSPAYARLRTRAETVDAPLEGQEGEGRWERRAR